MDFDLIDLTDQQLIENTFIQIISDSKLQELYLREISRRLFDEKAATRILAKLNEANLKVKEKVKAGTLQLLQTNMDQLLQTSFNCLVKYEHKPAVKKAIEAFNGELIRAKDKAEDDIIYTRNRIRSAYATLRDKQGKLTNLEIIQQEPSPAAKTFLKVLAVVASMLILPAICAMVYSKIRYGTTRFWQASNTTLLCEKINKAEQTLNIHASCKTSR